MWPDGTGRCECQCYLVFGGGGYVHTAAHPSPCVCASDAQCSMCSPMQLEGFSSFAANNVMCCAHVLSGQLSSLTLLPFIHLRHSPGVKDFLFVCFLRGWVGRWREWVSGLIKFLSLCLSMSHAVMSTLQTWKMSFPILINSSQGDKLNSHLELWKCNCSTIWSAVILYDEHMKKQCCFFTATANHHDAFREQLCRSGFCPKVILEPEDQLPGRHGRWPGKVSFIFPFYYFEVNAYRCFGFVLTFVTLTGTLNELYRVLIFSYAILITAWYTELRQRRYHSKTNVIFFVFTLLLQREEKKCHYHNNVQFMYHNYNRTLVTCWLPSLGNLNVITVLLQMSGGRGHFLGAIVERI